VSSDHNLGMCPANVIASCTLTRECATDGVYGAYSIGFVCLPTPRDRRLRSCHESYIVLASWCLFSVVDLFHFFRYTPGAMMAQASHEIIFWAWPRQKIRHAADI
jgi:hypothetical protein